MSDSKKDICKRDKGRDMKTSRPLKILDTLVYGLVDTEAEVTFCSEELWKRISRIVSRPQVRLRRNVTSIDFSGTRKTKVKGEVILLMVIDNISLYQRFFIVKGLNHDIILGKDLLTECRAKMDFEAGEVTLNIGGIGVILIMVHREKDGKPIPGINGLVDEKGSEDRFREGEGVTRNGEKKELQE